ncbi:hypothetical protein SIO70_02175 [Chitinophaga sancti]|uniref:hypothetical protein n=1 Tax=Chitinophaga sancti TaxID=1004 RepID=UPI002A752A76|nr:hypothetical protein [Chitinophaga sancti]WPQ63668.1 hypothetical protein SIO70_02175 [Chitinophaga sancti]
MKTQLFAILILLLTGCQKFRDLKKDSDARGEERIRGRLFAYNNLTQNNSTRPLGSKHVTIGYADQADTINYIYDVTTDAEGYFEFKTLAAGVRYRIRYTEEIEGVLYTASAVIIAPQAALALVAAIDRVNQNGFHIVIADSLGGTFKDMEICVFNSRLLFENSNCEQSSFKLNTDSLGRIYAFNLPVMKYYFRGSAVINNATYEIADSLTISDTIMLDTFLLAKKPVNEQNGIHYVIMDSFGGRIPGGEACVFTSIELYRRDTCEGSNFQIEIGADGSGEKRDIPQGTYYIFMERIFGEERYRARDTVIVASKLVKDTLWLRN